MAQLAQLKKEIPKTMRDFVAKFNKTVHKIPVNQRPSGDNLKCFFINSMPSEISFLIHRQRVQNLEAAKTLAIELEDDLITAGKWKREVQTSTKQALTSTTTSNPVIQRLMNDIIALKGQLTKSNMTYPQPYQDVPRRFQNQSTGTGVRVPQSPPV